MDVTKLHKEILSLQSNIAFIRGYLEGLMESDYPQTTEDIKKSLDQYVIHRVSTVDYQLRSLHSRVLVKIAVY